MAIAAVLKETKITHLKCAPSLPHLPTRTQALRPCDAAAPLQEPTSTHFSRLHRSLSDNTLEPEGGKAITAVLMDTQITNLKCAALPTTLNPQAKAHSHERRVLA